MPNRIQLALAAAAGIAVYEYMYVGMLRKRNRAHKAVATMMTDAYTSTNEQLGYMCHLLNEHGVQLDEFDFIALPSVTRKN